MKTTLTLLALTATAIGLSAYAFDSQPILNLKGRLACEFVNTFVVGNPNFHGDRVQMGTRYTKYDGALHYDILNSHEGNQYYCYVQVTFVP